MSSVDATAEQSNARLDHDQTLVVDNAVSLTLGSDSLLVVGKSPLTFVGWLFVADARKR